MWRNKLTFQLTSSTDMSPQSRSIPMSLVSFLYHFPLSQKSACHINDQINIVPKWFRICFKLWHSVTALKKNLHAVMVWGIFQTEELSQAKSGSSLCTAVTECLSSKYSCIILAWSWSDHWCGMLISVKGNHATKWNKRTKQRNKAFHCSRASSHLS